MRAHPTDIHTHTKWGRMVETVLAPVKTVKKAFGGVLTGKTNRVVPLNELQPQMLADASPPVVELTREQAERLHELAIHGPSPR